MGEESGGGMHVADQESGEAARGPKDILTEGLDVLFVGYNPGRHTAKQGHHFAGPGNYFWPLLYESGLTGRRLFPEDDGEVLFWGLGITNIVSRMTPSSGDLGSEELREGGRLLAEKVRRFQPKVVCCLGKEVYRHYADKPSQARVDWGLQSGSVVPAVWDYVAPNPSRRSTVPYGVRLALMVRLKGLVTYGMDSGTP